MKGINRRESCRVMILFICDSRGKFAFLSFDLLSEGIEKGAFPFLFMGSQSSC